MTVGDSAERGRGPGAWVQPLANKSATLPCLSPLVGPILYSARKPTTGHLIQCSDRVLLPFTQSLILIPARNKSQATITRAPKSYK